MKCIGLKANRNILIVKELENICYSVGVDTSGKKFEKSLIQLTVIRPCGPVVDSLSEDEQISDLLFLNINELLNSKCSSSV